jgi:hypothetical protein
VSAGQIEHPVADVLRVLAVSRSSGALEIRGLRSGTFFLHEGDITYAEALGVPPAEEFDAGDPRLRSTIQSSIVEVGLTLLGENGEGERPLFRPGRRHWSGRAIRVEVEALLAEIAQQMASFAELGVEPDDQVQLCGLSPGRLAVLSRRQWALAVELSGQQTARSLARRSGVPLGATIENLASLVAVGVVERGAPIRPPVTVEWPRPGPKQPSREPVAREPPGPESASRGLPARQPSGRAPAGRELSNREPPSREPSVRGPSVREPRVREPGGSEPPLPQRVRGATPLPPGAPKSQPPDTRPRLPPRHEPDAADSGRALALRLLEGLRRL